MLIGKGCQEIITKKKAPVPQGPLIIALRQRAVIVKSQTGSRGSQARLQPSSCVLGRGERSGPFFVLSSRMNTCCRST